MAADKFAKCVPLMDEERLVEAVRSYPCLWNNQIKAYKEQRTKENAWKAIQTQVSFVSPIAS